MGKLDEYAHRFNASLNAKVGVARRTGDVDDGDELGDLLTDKEQNVLDKMIAEEEREARTMFLKRFFGYIREILSPEEFKFLKLRYTKKKTDRQIVVWLGMKSAKATFNSIAEKLADYREKLERMAKASEWDGAYVFVKSCVGKTEDLIADHELMSFASRKKETRSFEKDPVFRPVREAYEIFLAKQNLTEEQKIRHRLYMRGLHHSIMLGNGRPIKDLQDVCNEIELKIYRLLGRLDGFDYIATASEMSFGGYMQELREIKNLMQEIIALNTGIGKVKMSELAEVIAEKLITVDVVARADDVSRFLNRKRDVMSGKMLFLPAESSVGR